LTKKWGGKCRQGKLSHSEGKESQSVGREKKKKKKKKKKRTRGRGEGGHGPHLIEGWGINARRNGGGHV